MIVGTLELIIVVRESHSLKDKRRVVKALKDRVRERFNVSIAEVGELDSRQKALLGVSCVGNERRHIEGLLCHVVNFVRDSRLAELVRYDVEVY